MKTIGVFLMIIGVVWGAVAFNADTTIKTESQFIGGIYIPSQSVHNIGKMDERRNHLMLSGLFVIIGVLLFGFGTLRTASKPPSSGAIRKCPFCAESVKEDAKICHYCKKDLPPLPDSTEATGQTEFKPCPHCRATLPVTADYCIQCNRAL